MFFFEVHWMPMNDLQEVVGSLKTIQIKDKNIEPASHCESTLVPRFSNINYRVSFMHENVRNMKPIEAGCITL